MNRLPSQPTPPFGLVAWLEETKITLPLKGVECRFDAVAGVVSVEIDQIFYQDSTRALDCTYTFPLPAGAAVHRCEMRVNDRVIRAKVEADSDAQRIFREQKEAGHRAVMVLGERENLFTLVLGNVQPGDTIVVHFAYFQTLERIADSLSVRIPVCPGMRYIPGKPLLRSLSGRGSSDDTDAVSDASRISPPRIGADDPGAACFAVSGRIAADDVALDSLSSPSHPVAVRSAGASVEVALAENGSVPDRDFVVRWIEPKEVALAPRAWSFRAGDESFALVQFRAPAEAPAIADIPQDVYFLLDRSGSMQGAKWEKTCEALRAFVEFLGADDRVWISLFETHIQDFAETPLPVARIREDAAFQNLVALGAAGGTELLPAAEHILAKIAEHSKDHRNILVLITDGQVGNEHHIVKRFRESAQTTVFTFGIDSAVNDAFLRDLATQTGGECWLQTPSDDIAGTVAKLADRLRRPVLVNLRPASGWETPGPRVADVHSGQTIGLSLRHSGPAPRTVEIAGRLGNGEERVFHVPLAKVENETIKLLWAREKIAALLTAGDADAALTLAKSSNLLCEGAAFVAWDEAEQVPVAAEEIYQPSLDLEMEALYARAFSSNRLSMSFRACSGDEGDVLPDAVGTSHIESARKHAAILLHTAKPSSNLRARLVDAGIAAAVVDLLLHWLHAGSDKSGMRRKLLEDFLGKLQAEMPDPQNLIRHCRKFIDLHFTLKPELHASGHVCLAEWEAGLPV